MFNDLRFAFSALRHPYSLLLLSGSLAATLLLFAGLATLTGWLTASHDPTSIGWVNQLLGYGSGFFVLVLGWFLFPVVMTSFACLFLEGLALRIERDHFADLPKAKDSDWGDAVALTGKTLWQTALFNLLVLPLYFIPIVNVAAYTLVNARLLSREYFMALCLRHLPLAAAESLYVKERWTLTKIGLQLSILFIIPGLNLFAPILATGVMLNRLESRPDGLLRQALALGGANVLPESY